MKQQCGHAGLSWGVDVNGTVLHASDGIYYGLACETQMCGGKWALELRAEAIARLAIRSDGQSFSAKEEK